MTTPRFKLDSSGVFEAASDAIRRQLEQSDKPRSVVLTFAAHGGFGGGMGTRMGEHLSSEYGRLLKQSVTLLPPLEGTDPKGYYNWALTVNPLLEHYDMA